jgi:hypothetical protein
MPDLEVLGSVLPSELQRQIRIRASLNVGSGRWSILGSLPQRMGVVAWTPDRLILGAVCLLEDAVNAAQIQR